MLAGGVTAAGSECGTLARGFRSTFLQTTGRPSAAASVALPRVVCERERTTPEFRSPQRDRSGRSGSPWRRFGASGRQDPQGR